MNKIIITTPDFTSIVSGSTTDMLVAMTWGAGEFFYGDVTDPDRGTGIPASSGYQIIVPAGIDVGAYVVGGMASIVVAPFGAA